MPRCLHVVHVAFEVNTDKISELDAVIKALQQTARDAVAEKINNINHFDCAPDDQKFVELVE